MKLKEIISFFKIYIKEDKKLFVKAFLLSFFSALSSIFYGLLIGYSSEYVIAGEFLVGILFLLGYFVLASVDTIFFERKGRIYTSHLCSNLCEKISFKCFSKTLVLPALAFEEKTSGELINRISNDSTRVSDTLGMLISTFLSIFSSLLIFIYICFNSWIIALEIVVSMLVAYYFGKKYLVKIKEKQKEISGDGDKLVALTNEVIRGVREVKVLGIGASLTKGVKKNISDMYDKIRSQSISENNYNALTYILSIVLEVSVFVTAIILIYFGEVSFGFFIAMTYYVYRFNYAVSQIMNISKSYQKMIVSIERISEITENKLYCDESFGSINKTNVLGLIEYRDVSFKYGNEELFIFNKLNLDIQPNKVTALVGKSGSGKSSMFNLLLRYFDVNEGEISIDGINIKDFSEESLRKIITVIRQEPFLFNRTILENFRMLDKNISLTSVRSVCKKAQIDDYIMGLENKYDTVIGEGGVNLSGGQKQRLAIARALLKKSKIILFDEATSALDNENQERIKKVIDDLKKTHTIIVVAHRLSTIENADIIHVVSNGKIVDSGNHKMLLKNSLIYKNLYTKEK